MSTLHPDQDTANLRPTTVDDLARECQALREQRDRLKAACLACMEAFDDRYDGAPDAGYGWMGELMHQIEQALGSQSKAVCEKFYIWSMEHGAYWRPEGAGYTYSLKDAGLYSRKTCDQVLFNANWGQIRAGEAPHEAMIPVCTTLLDTTQAGGVEWRDVDAESKDSKQS